MHICMSTCNIRVCVCTWACVPTSYRRLSSLYYWGFYVVFSIVIEIVCTGSRRSSMWGLCRRWLYRGLSLWQSPVRPVRHVDLLLPCGRYFFKHVILDQNACNSIFMYAREFLLVFHWTHAVIYMIYNIYIYILTVLAKFYDVCNPEVLCHCWFYLLFTCTLSEMMNKRCPTNQ